MRRALGSALGVAMLLASGAAASPGHAEPADVRRGEAYYTTCAGCHGNRAEGYRGMNAPRLAGLPADYLLRQLINFRTGVRGGDADFYGMAMNGRARALPGEGAVSDVVAYIATLPASPALVAPEDPRRGAKFYESCVACHGAKGEGNAALGAPPLRGLDDWYMAAQLRNFRSGVRGGKEQDAFGQSMKAAALVLPDDAALADVAAYAASLR